MVKGDLAMNKKQMKLKNFCEVYDIPRSTALRWANGDTGFPAYNLFGHWYVDIEAYFSWRELAKKAV